MANTKTTVTELTEQGRVEERVKEIVEEMLAC